MSPPDAYRPRARQDRGEITDEDRIVPPGAALVKIRRERLPRGWSRCWACGATMGPAAPGLAPYLHTLHWGGPACWNCLEVAA